MNQENFWKIRAERYNNLEWAKEPGYIDIFKLSADLNKNDSVLDVGTGTGIIADAIAPMAKEVIGLDISKEMLEQGNWKDNKYFIKRDIRDSFFHDNIFDKVVVRMVFHHILERTQEAMNECYRVLKKGGKMILSEGVPPSSKIMEFYKKVFRLKEERLVFSEEDLLNLMKNAGFKNIKMIPFIMKETSIRNWLDNNCLPKEKKDRIFEMYVTAPEVVKQAYNMKIINGDCLIDVKDIILVGEK